MLDLTPTPCPLCLGAARAGGPCAGCLEDIQASAPQGVRCPVCALALPQGVPCPDCALLKPAFDRVITAFDYCDPADQMIWQLKNAGRFHHARFLAQLLAQSAQQGGVVHEGITILLPVPSSSQALRRRGFNPAGEIARQVAARLNLAYRPGLMRRYGRGKEQKQLSRAARTASLLGRYVCTARIEGAVVAVVDDVLTTGATLHAVAQTLKQAGAVRVVGLIVARTPYRHNN